jgi:uncharacterized membrane protein YjjB (DUF3815 family)
MIKTIILGLVRHALTGACGYLISHGLVDQAGSQVLAGAVLGIAGVAWSAGQKLLQKYEVQVALKTMPPGILPPAPVGVVTKAE